MMGNHFGYTINGPQLDAVELPTRLSKSLSVRREPKVGGNNLRNMYQNPASSPHHRSSLASIDNALRTPATPVLPPTPPNAEDETLFEVEEPAPALEAAKARSILATPVNQISPPTPDNTPPRDRSRLRPFLGAQPSMTSTRAESFKTAQEDLPSDKESISSFTIAQPEFDNPSSLSIPFSPNTIHVHKPSPLANLPITNADISSKESSPLLLSSATIPPIIKVHDPVQDSPTIGYGDEISRDLALSGKPTEEVIPPEPVKVEQNVQHMIKSRKEGNRPNPSLRARLEDAQRVPSSPSMDKFASIIGWRGSVQNHETEIRRWSGVSNTSTIEAFLVEPPRRLQKRNTLRHVSKNNSLRSASSPLPNSNRTSMQSSLDSPHRLIHKKAKLNNHHRLSFGSEASQPVNKDSPIVRKVEVIRVAVIPERSSSLQRSSASSRRHSFSNSGAPTSFRMRNVSDGSHKRQANTDSAERGRARHYPPQVPTRGSSLSAPTSRNTSRANSITSEHVRSEQKNAEKALRNTLDRMESERMASSLRSGSAEETETVPARLETPLYDPEVHNLIGIAPPPLAQFETPGTKEWAELRPTSTLHTPFSQPSFFSASPEISEAKVISLHHHNNHSVQLIEPFPLPESQAVEAARKLNQSHYRQSENDNSPLRNPRRPPAPPQVHFIPATPQEEIQAELGFDLATIARPTTPKRPIQRQRTDSFKTLLRNVSLKNARNKKADQDLDSTLHPFWRPRPFWDGIDPISPEKKGENETQDRGMVNNSLGLPQQRLVIAGPLGLVRKISERRRNRNVIAKQSSYGSLRRLRTGRKLYRLPTFGMHVHILSFRDIQDKVTVARQKRDEEKREKRRDALRKSIGPNVIANGDSRFPANIHENDSLQRE